MFDSMEKSITFSFPSAVEYESVNIDNKNYSWMISTSELDEVLRSEADPKYEQFLADIWVGIILTLIVLSCVCCMCSCLLYHKFQQWKINMLQNRNAVNVESGTSECESLPSYSIASGLPSYSEALEQLNKVKELTIITTKRIENEDETWVPRTPPTPAPVTRLSVTEFLQLYKNSNPSSPSKV